MNYLAKKNAKTDFAKRNASFKLTSRTGPSNQSIDHASPVFAWGLRAKERPEEGEVQEEDFFHV